MTPSAMPAFHAFMDHAQRLAQEVERPAVFQPDTLLWHAWRTSGSVGLACPALHAAKSAHTTLALTPVVARANAAWEAWWDTVAQASPGLNPTLSIEACRPEKNGPPVFHLRNDRDISGLLPLDTLQATIHAYLAAIHALPLGTHRFTIEGTLASKGGCPRTMSRTYTAACAEDAVQMWEANSALVGDHAPITKITQDHNPEAVLAAVRARTRLNAA